MRQLCTLTLLLTSLLLTSCGSDEPAPASSSSTTLASISAVPKSTGPVVGSSSLQFAGLESSVAALASTGETFSSATSTAWQAGDSRAFCESVSLVKDLFSEAAEPDTISCYLGVMESVGLISNPFDGNDHYGELTNMSEGPSGTNPKIKFNITKDSDGLINSFKMWMCFGSSSSQTGYVEMTISSGSVSIVSKNTDSFSDGNGSTFTYSGDVSGSGTVNNLGQWLSKTITAKRRFAASGNFSDTFGSSATLTQSASDLEVSGYFTGSRDSSGQGAESFSNAFFSVMQIVNAQTMGSFAIGDGSSKFSISYTGPFGNDSFSSTDSWLGDTRGKLSTASDGDYYSRANAGSLPTVGSVPAVSFSGDQAWDCTAPSGFESIDFSTAAGQSAESQFQTCDNKYSANRDWVECYNAD